MRRRTHDHENGSTCEEVRSAGVRSAGKGRKRARKYRDRLHEANEVTEENSSSDEVEEEKEEEEEKGDDEEEGERFVPSSLASVASLRC